METSKGLGKPVTPKSAKELLDMYFLDLRSALLETAATLDRIERAEGATETLRDPRVKKLMDACNLLQKGKKNRAEKFLLLFSDPA